MIINIIDIKKYIVVKKELKNLLWYFCNDEVYCYFNLYKSNYINITKIGFIILKGI